MIEKLKALKQKLQLSWSVIPIIQNRHYYHSNTFSGTLRCEGNTNHTDQNHRFYPDKHIPDDNLSCY